MKYYKKEKDEIMEIAILSMQRVINYGSVLQAYSLKGIIEDITGEQVDFIDPVLENTMAVDMPVRDSDDYEKKEQYGMWLPRNVKKALDKINYKRLTKKIIKFQENELGISYSYDPHKKKYDLVIEGSDEVFKASDKIYLYMYGAINNANTLITYAAACGSASIQGLSEKNRTILKSLMTKYKIISVRDLHTYNYVKNLYDGKVERHLDPVLVGDLYKRKHNPVKLKKYMIVYAYGNRIRDEKEIKAIKNYAKKNGLQTIAVGAPQFWCDKFLVASPLEALDYFYYADYIVTDTFHGSIFSVINKRNFAVILRKSNKNKLGGLLRDLDLEDRIIDDMDNLPKILEKDIDYAKIDALLNKERVRTRAYLTEQIESIECR